MLHGFIFPQHFQIAATEENSKTEPNSSHPLQDTNRTGSIVDSHLSCDSLGLENIKLDRGRYAPIRERAFTEHSTISYSQEKPRRHRKNVSFSSVEIREHSVIVGDHPCCTSGLPVSLGWGHSRENTVLNVDDYEDMRPPRRSTDEMKTTYFQRKNLLKRVAGMTEVDLARAERRNKLNPSIYK